tara:strand:- start:2961 stop:3230 length:270 start_codon:yes stop_codon:yes gene_type:complete
MDEESIIVPVLSDSLSIITIVVPTNFMQRMEMHALCLVEAFEQHPDGMLDHNNKMMQAISYVTQTAVNSYLDLMTDHPINLPRQSESDE